MKNGDLKRFYGNEPNPTINDFVRVGANGKIPKDLIPDISGGVAIKVEEDATVSGETVPKLTKEQVIKAYNEFKNGSSVTIIDSTGKLQYKCVMGDITTGKESILIQYYWLAYVDYQITAQDEVYITVHPIAQPE